MRNSFQQKMKIKAAAAMQARYDSAISAASLHALTCLTVEADPFPQRLFVLRMPLRHVLQERIFNLFHRAF